MSSRAPTVQLGSVVYSDGVSLDDPAETFHEAAKLSRSTAGAGARGIRLLEANPELQLSVSRAGRRHPHRPQLPLPEPAFPPVSLDRALATRCSQAPVSNSRLTLVELATLVYALDGRRDDGHRTIPSGGALYPLELYVFASRVDGAPTGIHHFDPVRSSLECLPGNPDHLRSALVDRALAEAPAVLAITGAFWRSRFKYGQRGYRFTLLEAGHAMQNAVLAASALGLAALPIGGYYDGIVDELLGLNGVDESTIYLLAVGGAAEAPT